MRTEGEYRSSKTFESGLQDGPVHSEMRKKFSAPEYVGFGMLTHVSIMVLDKMPKRNTGAIVQEVNDFVFDDAAIVACLLRPMECSLRDDRDGGGQMTCAGTRLRNSSRNGASRVKSVSQKSIEHRSK